MPGVGPRCVLKQPSLLRVSVRHKQRSIMSHVVVESLPERPHVATYTWALKEVSYHNFGVHVYAIQLHGSFKWRTCETYRGYLPQVSLTRVGTSKSSSGLRGGEVPALRLHQPNTQLRPRLHARYEMLKPSASPPLTSNIPRSHGSVPLSEVLELRGLGSPVKAEVTVDLRMCRRGNKYSYIHAYIHTYMHACIHTDRQT